jgi:hypothetical protein
MLQMLQRILEFFGFRRRQPPEKDPFAWRPVPRTRSPKGRSDAVAVAEPDE